MEVWSAAVARARRVPGDWQPGDPALREKALRVQTDMVSTRFEPRDSSELFSAIFTWWSILDSVMVSKLGGNYASGYVRELQLRRMVQLVQTPQTNRYCEIGMNGGHSVVAMLEANRNLTADVFDLMAWSYSADVGRLLSTRFGSRFRLHRGDSKLRVPALAKSGHLNGTCDLLFIDGNHHPKGVRDDLLNCRRIAAPGARLVIDDVAVSSKTQPGPVVALRQMEAAGVVRVHERYGTFPGGHYYNPCMRKPASDARYTKTRTMQFCIPWGFAVGVYDPVQQFNSSWTSASIMAAGALTPDLLLEGDFGQPLHAHQHVSRS